MKKKRNRSYFEFLVLFVLFWVVIHMYWGGGTIKRDPNPADVPRLKTPLPLVASRV